MTTFTAESRDASGQRVNQVLDAASRAEAVKLLEAAGLFPIEVRELLAEVEGRAPESEADSTRVRPARVRRSSAARKAGRPVRYRWSAKQLRDFTLQLEATLDAGVPILAALEAFERQAERPEVTEVLLAMGADLAGGRPLSEAMEQHPRAFPQVYCAMIAAGEQSGALDAVLGSLSEFIESEMEVRADVRSALMYPAAVVVALMFAVVTLILFVIPRFSNFYSGFGSDLPLPTRVLIGISGVVTRYGWAVALGAIVLGALGASWARSEQGRRALDAGLLRIPIVGRLLDTASTMRIAQMLGLFSRAGVPILQGLETIATTVSSPSARDAVFAVAEEVAAGRTLGEGFESADCLKPAARQMIATGEAAGGMEPACMAVVRHQKKELRYLTKNLGTLIEPVLTAGLAAIVLFVALAVFLPMWDLVGMVGG